MTRFSDGTGRLSPHVYWWRDGSWSVQSGYGEDGSLSPVLSPEFARLLAVSDP